MTIEKTAGDGQAVDWPPQDLADPAILSLGHLAGSHSLFEQFPFGLVLVERDGAVVHVNRKARQMLLPPSDRSSRATTWRCCELICNHGGPIVGGGCLSQRVFESGSSLPEVRIDIDGDRLCTAAWVSGTAIAPSGHRILFHLRPGSPKDRRRRTHPAWSGQLSSSRRYDLQIITLGSFHVEGPSGPIGGEWLDQRPGQLLKFLVGARQRVVSNDQVAEAMWPEAGSEEARNRLRYYVHALREKLEPDRAWRSPSRFIVARRGGYLLDTSRIWIDVDEFELEVGAGLAALDQELLGPAAAHMTRALGLYGDAFLNEDPYAEWALGERERLRELAGRALQAEIEIQRSLGNRDAVAAHARRLAEMEPFDTDVQKLVIELCLESGRRSEAFRRYAALRKRMLSNFGHEPEFDLTAIRGVASP